MGPIFQHCEAVGLAASVRFREARGDVRLRFLGRVDAEGDDELELDVAMTELA
jgi:hypothetical protein